MKPSVWGTWPGELVKQYGRFRLHTSVTALPQGVLTDTRRYRVSVENGEEDPVNIGSIERGKSSREGLIAYVKEWQRVQLVYISRWKDYQATGEHAAAPMQQLEKLEARYQIVENALHELEASQ